jgi:ubiquinone biosynthesis protein Coq4
MTRIEMLKEAAVLLRTPETIGDGALLKSLAISDRGYPAAREHLAAFAGDFPQLDPAALARLPDGTFGREVARFCDDNHITLLRPSDRLRDASRADPVAVRYAATHDLVHVLLGEGADYAGEAAVYGWACGQRYSRLHWVALVLSCTLWSLFRPWQAVRIVRGALRGYRKGRGTPMLLAERFEDRLGEPLGAVRASLGVSAA